MVGGGGIDDAALLGLAVDSKGAMLAADGIAISIDGEGRTVADDETYIGIVDVETSVDGNGPCGHDVPYGRAAATAAKGDVAVAACEGGVNFTALLGAVFIDIADDGHYLGIDGNIGRGHGEVVGVVATVGDGHGAAARSLLRGEAYGIAFG